MARPFFYARDLLVVRDNPAVFTAWRALRHHAATHPPHLVDFEAVRAGVPPDALVYGETPVSVALALLRWAGAGPTSHVVDLGAGRGTVLLAARLLGATARGVEADRNRASAAPIVAAAGAQLAHGDARTFDLSGATHVFLAWTTWPASLRAEVQARLAGVRAVALTHAPRGPAPSRSVRMPWGRADVFQVDVAADVR